jgi:hypothetical protein
MDPNRQGAKNAKGESRTLARATGFSLLGVLGALAVASLGCGAPLEQRGWLAADARVFLERPRSPGQKMGTGLSVAGEPEVSLQTPGGTHTITVRPFFRWDPEDEGRTHADLRQADWLLAAGPWELGAGVGLFSWGVMEQTRVVDVLNQPDLAESMDRSAKLGQPYLRLGTDQGSCALSFWALPYFRERTFPGPSGRLRPARVVDTEHPIFEPALGPWHPSFAGRFSFTWGELDVGLSGFAGVSREPRFFAQLADGQVVPRYELGEQAGLDAQWTHDVLILKAEAVTRWTSNDHRFSWAASGGLELSLFSLGGSGLDLTLVGEATIDSRPRDELYTVLEHDAFGGLRLALNDSGSTELRAGAVTDVLTGTTFAAAHVERTFFEHWRLALGGRAFLVRADGPEAALAHDHLVEGRIAYHF